ncbi:hypothetical protein AAF712_013875 [Marasmius tenuissimus]|uniref:DUF6533 domain-containing protein n=1 Tax=Marasmius tenuissimus TaxID=585030 RepID=A0ABR2ZEG3_9AGAR
MKLPTVPFGARAQEELLVDSRTTNYVAVASLTLLVYDHLLTLDKEVELIWTCKKRFASIIYLFNHYFSLLAIAVWILYRSSKKLLYWLASLVAGEFISMLSILHFVVLNVKEYVHAGPVLWGCHASVVPEYYAFMPVPSLIVSIIMFVLTIYKCCSTRYSAEREYGSNPPIVALFKRDGIFWFLAVFAAMIPHTVIVAAGRKTLAELMINLCLATYSIVSSRALLNIKQIMLETEEADSRVEESLVQEENDQRIEIEGCEFLGQY